MYKQVHIFPWNHSIRTSDPDLVTITDSSLFDINKDS